MGMMTPQQRVAQGAVALDKFFGPGWEGRINLQDLDIAYCETCMMGQLDGDYNTSIKRLGISAAQASEMGIYVIGDQESPTVRAEYNDLTTA